ncbi:unnamed protein product, partial [Ilex paraguariensis]
DLACNSEPKGFGGANVGVQHEVVHIDQLATQQEASTLNKSSTGENAIIDLSDISSDQANAFCKKGCDHFNLLGLIFGKSTATSLLARASTQLEKEFITGQKRSSATLDDDLEGLFPFPPKKIASISRQKKGSKSSKMDNAMDAWATFSLARTEKYKRTCQVNTVNGAYNIDVCMNVLEGIEVVGSQQHFRACAKFKDPEWHQMFLKMSAQRRKEWLDTLD